MRNSDIFLQDFNKLENYLKEKESMEFWISFSQLISRISKKNPEIRKYESKLKQYGNLRNAIVHDEKFKQRVIAEPHKDIVEELKVIIKKVMEPKKVIPMFKSKVLAFQAEDSIEKIIKIMYEKSFSQVPIYINSNFEFLLTSNTITRWIGSKSNDEIFDFNENRVEELKDFEEETKNFLFINRDINIYEVIEKFNSVEFPKLEALLITNSGKKHEKLLGIITYADLPKLIKEL